MANYILGKVKRKQKMFRVLVTETEVYNTDELILNGIDYNPSTLIENEETYQLTDFSQSGYCLDFLTNELNTVEHDQILKVDLKKMTIGI